VAAAVFLFFNEGVHNWQSLWTAAAFVLFGAALWPPHAVVVWGVLSNIGNEELAIQPIAVASLPQPMPQTGAAGGFVATTSKVECDK
jgi:hypothetical protein